LGSVQTPLAELSALPTHPLAVFKGPTSKGKEGKGKREGKEGEEQPPILWRRAAGGAGAVL